MVQPRKIDKTVVVSTLCWLFAGALMFFSLQSKIRDPDLWWHLAAGRAMVENLTFLRTDIFSHTLAGCSWINFEWLSQIVLYLLMRSCGLGGLFYAKIFFSLSALFWLVVSLRVAGVRGPLLLMLASVGFLLLRPRFAEKVELATLNFIPIFMGLLLWARDAAPSTRRFLPYLLGGLMVLWVNLHAGFIYGLGIVFLMTVGARIARENAAYVALLDRCLAVLFVAILVNPYGPRLVQIFIEHLYQFHHTPGLIQEWNTPTLQKLPLFWGLFVLTAAVLVREILKKNRAAFLFMPLVLVFAVWGTVFYRTAPLFTFVALPLIGAVSLTSAWGRFFAARRPRALAVGLWILSALPLLSDVGTLRAHAADIGIPSRYLKPAVFPEQACRFIEENSIDGVLYNSYEFGGYIEWILGPQRKVFDDGRYLFYSFLEEESELNFNLRYGMERSGWPAYLAKYGVTYAIAAHPDFYVKPYGSEKLAAYANLNVMFPRSDWALVFWDDVAFVFLKRIPRYAPVIARHEFKYVWPYSLERMEHMLSAHLVPLDGYRSDLDRQRKDVGPSLIGQKMENIYSAVRSKNIHVDRN